MVPVDVVLGIAAALGGIGTFVFGGGMFRQMFSHSNKMAIQSHRQDQTEVLVKDNNNSIISLQMTVALQNQNMEGFQRQLIKLDLIPDISAKLNSFGQVMDDVKDQLRELREDRIRDRE